MSAKTKSIAGAPWLAAPQTLALVAALDREADSGPAIRFVGGCVRNTLLGLPEGDIDVATVHPPEKVRELALAAGLKAVDTGIAHGTVTVIVQGKPFEVTTLRIDVKPDGRRAQVAYTQDWSVDASRRDFTINAIFADAGGVLLDFVGGLADLEARRVRFIGDATARIREDYLRILRFFRFHAWYGKGALDAKGLAACASEKQGLARLSAERVQKELLRLLEAPDPLASLKAMASAGIIEAVLPEAGDFEALAALIAVEQKLRLADPVRRLAIFLKPDRDSAAGVARRLRLSNEMRERLIALEAQLHEDALSADIDEKALRRLLYVNGIDAVADHVVLSWAANGASKNAAKWPALLSFADKYERPKLPITGRDVMALGVLGAKVGEVLEAVENWWIAKDFAPDKPAVLARAKEMIDQD